MFTSIVTLSLAALAAAAPSSKRQIIPNYPPTSQSRGFKLIANVTDLSSDFNPSIRNWVVEGAHTGAGTNTAVLTPYDPATNNGRTFYLNGTAEDVHYGNTHVLTDAGTPPAPFGIYTQNKTEFEYLYPDEHGVSINVGAGTGTTVTRFPEPYAYILSGTGSGTYVACNNTVPYYGTTFITLEYAYETFTGPDGGYEYNANIPEGCAPVRLLPQCTELNELPEDALSSHEFAANNTCYPDVASIDWSQYGP